MIDSARRDCRHQLDFLVITHSRLPEKTRELEQIADDPDVELFDYGVNRGLAKSWNEGILWGYDRGADVVLVVNEDVQFEAGDVTRLAGAAHAQRDKFLVMGRCFHEDQQRWERSEYGCFAYNPPAFQLLGCFDENFFPIYLEDSDFRRRATLAGLEPGYCEDVAIHHIGSASLRQAEVARQNELTYAANQAYYHRKWGGQGGAEQFNRPFDDPRFSYFIDPRVRKTPYPGFDRDDHHLVTI
jgi:GT2 family glycosyltransferase